MPFNRGQYQRVCPSALTTRSSRTGALAAMRSISSISRRSIGLTHDLARGPSPDELRREMERAAGRLLEIALALRDFLDDGDGAM